MGGLVLDYLVDSIRALLNMRFGAGDPITEMAALQEEFDIFSRAHTLRSACAVLGLYPQDVAQRQGWYEFLDALKNVTSDVAGQNGHDRIRNVLRRNLSAKQPMAVYFTIHGADEHAGVRVSEDVPAAFTRETYLIVSVPMVPRGARRRAGGRARARRKRGR